MSWKVEVVKLEDVRHHPNADLLDLANVGDYVCIIGRDQYQTGDLVAYIPEQSLLPDSLVEEMGLVGKLGNGNRVKAKKLRGVFSQGLVYRAKPEWNLGDDVAEILGITKWNPEDAINNNPRLKRLLGLGANVFPTYPEDSIFYDIENFKKTRKEFESLIGDRDIVVTEKIHGSLGCYQFMSQEYVYNRPNYHAHVNGLAVASKGRLTSGLFIKPHSMTDSDVDMWWKIAYTMGFNELFSSTKFAVQVQNVMDALGYRERLGVDFIHTFKVFGEVFGHQDLKYNLDKNLEDHEKWDGRSLTPFRIFDVYVGEFGKGCWMDWEHVKVFALLLGVETAPVLYEGPYSLDKIKELTDGRETVTGLEQHIREGVVVKEARSNAVRMSDRLIAKSISEAYLLRGGDVTEFT